MNKFLLSIAAIFIAITPLSAATKVLALAGSTRTDSYNKKLAQQAANIAEQSGATVTFIDLRDYPMPFYDADLEMQGMPENAKRFRNLMIANDAIIIASPEYNCSLPAVLKNALDWASRNEEGGSSRDAYLGKKFAIMSASPGGGGGKRGLVHLRAVIENVGGTVVPTQTTIPNAHDYFSKKPLPANPTLNREIEELLKRFS